MWIDRFYPNIGFFLTIIFIDKIYTFLLNIYFLLLQYSWKIELHNIFICQYMKLYFISTCGSTLIFFFPGYHISFIQNGKLPSSTGPGMSLINPMVIPKSINYRNPFGSRIGIWLTPRQKSEIGVCWELKIEKFSIS